MSLLVAGAKGASAPRLPLIAFFVFSCVALAPGQSVMTRFIPSPEIGGFVINRGDFNNDGVLDLITANNCGDNSTCQGVTVYLGRPNRAFFNGATSGPAGLPANDIAIGDFNGDGKLDVALTGYLGGGTVGVVQVLLGRGDGTFSTGQQINIGETLGSLTASDFNNDGKMDLAVQTGLNQVTIFAGAGDGTFVSVGSHTVQSSDRIVKIRVGDFDRDGKTDIAVLTIADLFVLWGEGNFAFTTDHLANYPNTASDMTPADVNQDGYTDLIVSYGTCSQPNPKTTLTCPAWTVLESEGNSRSFRQMSTMVFADNSYSGFSSFSAADVNGDGINDIVALTFDSNNVSNGSYATCEVIGWLGNADGTYQRSPFKFVLGSDSSSSDLVVGDFNRDGRLDFATVNPGDTALGLGVMLNTTPQAPCQRSTESPIVTVCQPVNFTYFNSPLRLLAGATDATTVTAMQVYADHKLVFQSSGDSLNVKLPLSRGSHFLVTKAWDAAGHDFWSPRLITIYGGIPGETCTPAPLAMTICSPAENATTSTLVHVFATAESDRAITSLQVYMDNNLIYNDTSQSTYIDTGFRVSPGAHFIVAKAWDSSGRIFSDSRMFTAQ